LGSREREREEGFGGWGKEKGAAKAVRGRLGNVQRPVNKGSRSFSVPRYS
jgi:hypothetical protein